RRVLTRGEVRNHRLATLATHFHVTTAPNHRALADARATGEVLHALLERVAPLGVTHAEDLATLTARVPARRRKKARLADDLPTGAGVYWFVGPGEEILYVGTSTHVRRRVRSYFTAAENRSHIAQMLDLACAVRAEATAGVLEAQVRELRLIAAHQPPFNRRSRHQDRARFLTLTNEAYPRSIVTKYPPADPSEIIGIFPSTKSARLAQQALQRATGLRTCTHKLPRIPAATSQACSAYELGRCLAPCAFGQQGYDAVVARARQVSASKLEDVLTHYQQRFAQLSAAERFESASVERDRLATLLQGRARFEQLLPYLTAGELVAARPGHNRRWELIIVRYGRLASAIEIPAHRHVGPYLHAALQLAEPLPPPTVLGQHATIAETATIAAWCESPGVRFGEVTDARFPFAYPRMGAASDHYRIWRSPHEAVHRGM
ncbi:MAG: DNA polymerase III subunit epsilon, partial [Bowdeniella nasicola]|nr:DNA polymerase III subunit epsilon [Bowdeniella nasicola]